MSEPDLIDCVVAQYHRAPQSAQIVHECGNTLGKLLRTIYLCDLLSNP
jgi:hypothetical protein